MRFSIRKKLILYFLITALLPLLVVGIWSYVSTTVHLRKEAVATLHSEIDTIAYEIDTFLEDIRGELLFLSELSGLHEMFEAEDRGEDDKVDFWRDKLAVELLSFSRRRGTYDQIRYIDKEGQEVIRVNADGGKYRIVPRDELQNKKDRYYFPAAMALRPDEIYVSPLDLNREGTPPEIEIPYKAVIRYATPVIDGQGKKRGILIVNILAEHFLKYVSPRHLIKGEVNFLVDQDGYYLFHPDHEKEWGGPRDLATGVNISQDYPDWIVRRIIQREHGDISKGYKDVIAYHQIFPYGEESDRFWVVAASHPRSIVFAFAGTFAYRLGIVAVGSFFLVLLLGVLLSGRITGPIFKLVRGSHILAGGNFDQQIDIKTRDEFESLAGEFNKMARELKGLYTGLEKKVEDRTRELQQANERLRELDRLKSDFLSSVSHEMRTPLNSIMGYSEILMTYKDEEEKKKEEFLNIIFKESKRMAALVNDMLDLSKIEAGKREWRMSEFRIEEPILSTLKAVDPQVKEKGLSTQLDLQKDLPKVKADKQAIEQVLTNLMSNAVKFTPKDGKITVAASSVEKDIKVSVTDTGVGIPKEDQEKIFDKFVQVTKRGGEKPRGTGLGLSIAQEIVKHHKGKIWVESEVRKGSTFSFTLPLS